MNEVKKALGLYVPAKLLETGFENLLGIRWNFAFMLNSKLLHLDLSFNKISYEDTEEMSIGLKENTTLYGIHYAGNSGRIDSLGFMHAIASKFHLNPKMQILGGGKIKGVKSRVTEKRGKFPESQKLKS
jgi:hypothetical protein